MSDEQDIDEAPIEQLPLRWTRFIDAYMGDANGNGTRAARMAGYPGNETSLSVQAVRLLANARVKAAMSARIEGDHLAMSRIERIRFLSTVARGEAREQRYVGRDKDDKPIYEYCEPTLRERLAAEEALSKRSGEQVTKVAATNAAGEDVKGMTIEQLMAMAALGKGGE